MNRPFFYSLLVLLSCYLIIAGGTNAFSQSYANLYGAAQIQKQIDLIKSKENTDAPMSLQQSKALLRRCQQIGRAHEVISVCHLAGRIAHQSGKMDTAIYFFQLGIASCKTADTWHNIAVFYNNIAASKHLMASYKEAAEYYQKAINYARLFPPQSMPIEKIYSNYGVVFTKLGLFDEAIAQFEKALQVKHSTDSISIVIGALQGMGTVYKNKNDEALAIKYYDSAISIAHTTGYYKNHSILLNNLAEIQLNQNNFQSALNHLLKAETIGVKNHLNASYLTTIKANLGTTYLRLGYLKKAEQYLLEAYQSQLLIPNGRKDVIGQLSELYAEKRQFQKAYDFNLAYFKLKDSLQGEQVALQVSDLEKRYQSVEKDNEIIKAKLLVTEQNFKLEKKDWWIFIISLTSFFSIGSIIIFVIWRSKRNRNRQTMEKLKSQITGEERERSRLSKDLHDGVNSTLNAIKIYLNAATKQDSQLINNPIIIKELEGMLEAASNDIRTVAHNLTPHALSQSGLSMSIKYFCSNAFGPNNIVSDIQIYEGVDQIDPELALSIYRIVQELTQNIVKHAQASSVILLLYKNEEKIVLLVEDNGIGLSAVQEGKNDGIGLSNIRERVKAHQGKMTIEKPEQAKGLVVCIEFPI